MKPLKSLTSAELEQFVTVELGLDKYRVKQVSGWIFRKNATSFSEMTDISCQDRTLLSEKCSIGTITLAGEVGSTDGTRKLLFKLADGARVESVLIPDGDRLTLCISTQVGCKMGCSFCVTGMCGFVRNLESYEIIDQVQAVRRHFPQEEPTNIVFMGMGEPLDNLDEVSAAIVAICSPDGLNVSQRRLTVSTCGLVPEIPEFARRFPKVKLAVSLNAPDDETRKKIMPIASRYCLSELLSVLRHYPLARRQKILFEYVLIKDMNDSTASAGKVCELLKGIPSKVNLILLNRSDKTVFAAPSMEQAMKFQAVLHKKGLTVTIRKSRGDSIMASCGQLGMAAAARDTHKT